MRKHPVSIALSNRMLQRIDQEALKQKSSRSEFVELFFEDAFFLRMLSLTPARQS